MVDIIQSQGGLDVLAGSFMHALQLSQQLRQQKEQLDLERQRTAASIGSEQANAQEARARTKQLDQQTEDIENQQAGLRLATGHLADIGDDKAFAQDLQGVDPGVAAHAITARNMLLKGQLDVQESRARLKETEGRTQGLLDEHQLNQMILPTVQQFMQNPNAPLPKDPNRAQAVAMDRLGVLSYINQRMAREAQRAGENAQADMATRQAIFQAYGAATQAQTEFQFQNPGKAIPPFEDFFGQSLQPLGVGLKDAQGIIQESFQNYTRRHGSVGSSRAPVSAPSALEPLFNNPRYKLAQPVTQQQMLDAAYAVAAGKPLAAGLDDETRTWILRAAARIKATKRSGATQ